MVNQTAKPKKRGRPAKTKQERNTRKDLLRQAVIDAAAHLFAEKGVGGTNFRDIADQLGISRPSIYYYFKGKEDILATLVEEVTVFSGNQAMQLAADLESDPGETLRLMVFNHARWILEHPVEFKVIDRSESDLPLAVRRIHDKAKRTLLDNFIQVIDRGIDTGHFRPVDSHVAAFALLGMCNWTAWWYSASGRLSVADIAASIGDLAINSLKRTKAPAEGRLDLSDAFAALRDDLTTLERATLRTGSSQR